jgi:isocitrate dehydrogenase
MFEAIHGSAPRRAGQNLANPSGLLLGAVMMLVHIDQADVAERVHNAWLKTIEDGVHTYDIFKDGVSRRKVGTKEFSEAVMARVGQKPQTLRAVSYEAAPKQTPASHAAAPKAPAKKETIGVDVYVGWRNPDTDALAAKLAPIAPSGLKLTMLTSRGIKVWPNGAPETFRVDECRCRFLSENGGPVTQAQIVDLLGRITHAGLEFIKTENLATFDGEQGFSLGQGE